MDEDLIKALCDRIASSQKPQGFSHAEGLTEAGLPDSLLEDYRSGDRATARIAAFRVASFVGAKRSDPVDRVVSRGIASALLDRLQSQPCDLGRSDLEIGIFLWQQGVVERSDIEALVERLQGRHDLAVAELASLLMPIIGTEFLSGYLRSSELFETGGMGGPKRPLLREMAQQALAAFNRNHK